MGIRKWVGGEVILQLIAKLTYIYGGGDKTGGRGREGARGRSTCVYVCATYGWGVWRGTGAYRYVMLLLA